MKIENIEQLNAEIEKLKAKSDLLRAQLKQDYEEIKEELKPKNILLDTLNINQGSVFEKGLSFVMGFLLQRVFLKTELGVEKQARAIFGKASETIAKFLKKIFKKKEKEVDLEEDGNFTGE